MTSRSPREPGGRADEDGQTGGDRTAEGGRTRATSSEWRQYYERADRIRARFGDPFQRLIERGEFRSRVFRVGMTVVAVAAVIALGGGLVWLLLDAHLGSIIGAPPD